MLMFVLPLFLRLWTLVENEMANQGGGQTAVFEDFAGEAVALCRQSLSTAAGAVAAREGNGKLDGQLFLIRHLLLLKEMVRSVDLVHIERAADFSSVTGQSSPHL